MATGVGVGLLLLICLASLGFLVWVILNWRSCPSAFLHCLGVDGSIDCVACCACCCFCCFDQMAQHPRIATDPNRAEKITDLFNPLFEDSRLYLMRKSSSKKKRSVLIRTARNHDISWHRHFNAQDRTSTNIKIDWAHDNQGKASNDTSQTLGWVRARQRVSSNIENTRRFELVPAEEGFKVALEPPGLRINKLEAIATLEEMYQASFEEKTGWILHQLDKIKIKWESGHQIFEVHRADAFEEAFDFIEQLSTTEMRQTFRIQFIDEAGLDAGGVARDFFNLVTKRLLDPDFGFFTFADANQRVVEIDPLAKAKVAGDDASFVQYFHFAGRLLGKSLLEGFIVPYALSPILLKHLTGSPVSIEDLKLVDPVTVRSMEQMLKMDPDQLEMLCLDFTETQILFGKPIVSNLMPGGAGITVDQSNLNTYLEKRLKWKLFDSAAEAISKLLEGFYEVIPEHLLCILNYEEISLLLSGNQHISLKSWRSHTVYDGKYKDGMHSVVQWFWSELGQWDDARLRRLLHFVTGSPSLPAHGFAVLQSHDGLLCPFTITHNTGLYPHAHTCFNRLHLPEYSSPEEMREYLIAVVDNEMTMQFDLE